MSKNTENKEIQNKDSLIAALKEDFAASVNRIYINSIGEERDFREISVLEQKQLSRITIDNNNKNRKDVVFEAQCALINKVCTDPTFDIYQLKEVDRLKLLIALYQANMYKSDVKFVCEECGAENYYKLDFDSVIKKLDEIKVETTVKEYENKQFKYKFEIEYPSVKRAAAFYRAYSNKYKGAKKNEAKTLDNMSNMDYINLYVKTVDIEVKSTGAVKHIDFNEYLAGDIEDILACFPQDVLYSEDGVLYYIINNYIKCINDSFEVQKCFKCGAVHENTVTNAESFL